MSADPTPEVSSDPQVGAVVLVATPIGNLGDVSDRARDELRRADVIAAEDTRRTRALLSHLEIPAGSRIRSMHEHNEHSVAVELVEAAQHGARVVCVTDAGTPGLSDPGAVLVRAAVDGGVAVESVPGPSAALGALVISGLPTDRFVFEGFLPRKGRARAERLDVLADESRTAIVYESPRRVAATLADLATRLGDARAVAVCRELTKLHEQTWRGTVGAAAAHFGEIEARGEFVIVLAGAPQPAGPDDDAVRVAVAAAMAEGLSTRDAAVRVAADLGVPKNRAYRLATDE